MIEDALIQLLVLSTYINLALAFISLLLIITIIVITYNKENHSLPINRE